MGRKESEAGLVSGVISIVDYDMGNLRSVQKALEVLGHSARVVRTAEEVAAAEKVILPGIGSFGDAMKVLNERGLNGAVRTFAATGRPLLGVCLGMQLLFEFGEEDGGHRGLGLLDGVCVRLKVDAPPLRLKVPHMGWNKLVVRNRGGLLAGVGPEPYVYFVHSYHVVPRDPTIISASAEYGGPVTAVVEQGNIAATQFHPEKSQRVGLSILEAFGRL